MSNLHIQFIDNLYVFTTEEVEDCLLKLSNISQLLEEGQKEELL